MESGICDLACGIPESRNPGIVVVVVVDVTVSCSTCCAYTPSCRVAVTTLRYVALWDCGWHHREAVRLWQSDACVAMS